MMTGIGNRDGGSVSRWAGKLHLRGGRPATKALVWPLMMVVLLGLSGCIMPPFPRGPGGGGHGGGGDHRDGGDHGDRGGDGGKHGKNR
jgi:hypothetical protein